MIQRKIKERLASGDLLKLTNNGGELVVLDNQGDAIVVTVMKNGIEKSKAEYGLNFISSIAEVYKNYNIIGA